MWTRGKLPSGKRPAKSVAWSWVDGALSNARAQHLAVMLTRHTGPEDANPSPIETHRRVPRQAPAGRQVARFAVVRRHASRLVHPRPARYPSWYVAHAVPHRRAPSRARFPGFRRGARAHGAARRHCDAFRRFRYETRTRRRRGRRRCSRWHACSLARLVAVIASPGEAPSRGTPPWPAPAAGALPGAPVSNRVPPKLRI